MKKLIVLILLLNFSLIFNALAEENKGAGKVLSLKGEAYAVKNNYSRDLYKGSLLYSSDKITTGEKSRLSIEMIDGTQLTIGTKTTFQIEQYQYDAKTSKGTGLFKFINGFFRAVSGKLAKIKSNHFKFKTSFAVIGVKGTEFWGGFWDGGKFEVALLAGKGVVISNQAGEVEITNVGWGSTLVADDVSPTPPKPWGKDKIARALATVADIR